MEIITNWKPRELQCKAMMPAKAAADFDYTEDDYEYRFVQYKSAWYDVFDTQRIDPAEPDEYRTYMGWAIRVHPGSPLAHFDAIISDSYFSGVLFRYCADDDTVVCGRYMS